VPIENVVNGTVREVYDLLLEHDLEIVGEVVVPVRLCLAALPGSRLDQIERVYSHIQALGQADRFLRTRPWALLTTYNTAGAGKLIAERAEAGSGAVLSPRAAAHFGLEVLADEIENDPANRTRFVLVARPGAELPGGWRHPLGAPVTDRTTLAFAVRNEPGTLLSVLRVLADRQLNLSTLESRPSREVAWEYVFWADVDADLLAPDGAAALAEIRPLTTMIRVLGAYQRAAGS
jgi:prephenate dehydratase